MTAASKHGLGHVAPDGGAAAVGGDEPYRTLFRLAPSGVVLNDAEGHILAFNDQAHQQLGYTREEFARLHLADLDANEAPEDVRAHIAQIAAAGGDEYEVQHRTKGGEIRSVLVRTRPVDVGDGRRGFLNVWQDITDRKRAEDALRRAEESLREQLAVKDQLAKVAASVPGVVCSCRVAPDGHASLPFAGPGLEDLYGVSRDAAADDMAAILRNVHPDDAPGLAAANEAAARSLSPWHHEFRYLHPTKGLRWIEGRSLPTPEPDGGTLFHGYVADVTEEKRLQEALAQSQKLESVGRLAGGVAHDFNNILTVVLLCAEELRAHVGADPALGATLGELLAAGARARDLTRQLLAFARRQPITPVPVDLNELLERTARLLRRVLGEHIEIALAPGRDLWPVRADPGQLEQVVLNLAVNARDAMPRGGRLSIETSNVVAGREQQAAFPGLAAGDWVRVAVRDSGTGMTEEARQRVFEPFFTTKALGQGTGLGLATVYGIVKQSDGHIRVDTAPGRGTAFEILLPRTLEPARHAASPTPSPVAAGREAVLLVEDDALVREVAARTLRSSGYGVRVAPDAHAALALAEDGLAIDLLVTDVVMPGLDGRELALRFRHRRPGARVLFVSGYAESALTREGVVDAGVELLPKPFTPAELLAKVRSVLDRRAPGDPPARASGGAAT